MVLTRVVLAIQIPHRCAVWDLLRDRVHRVVLRAVLKDSALRVVALAASAVALATLQKHSSRYC